MKIINTDGLVLFGPGSEWLWFMLQFLALATTFYAIYHQLRLQASQGAIEQIKDVKREYESERMLRYRLAIAIGLRDGNRPPGFAAIPIIDYWDALGGLARLIGLIVVINASFAFAFVALAWWQLRSRAVAPSRD